jgi:hypothetical protein
MGIASGKHLQAGFIPHNRIVPSSGSLVQGTASSSSKPVDRTLGENQLRSIVRSGLAAMAATLALASIAAPVLAPVARAAARTAAAAPVADELLGVSCPAPSLCLAVGVNHDGFGGAGGPLAEIWNGTGWHSVTVRLPAGATAGALSGVDCLSVRDCIAVGFYDTGSAYPYSQFALVDTWNGKTWAPVTAPSPEGHFTELSGVSCVSATRCVAVGTYSEPSSAAPLAEIWNGRTWTPSEPPVGIDNGVGLVGVSCVRFPAGRFLEGPLWAAASCFAVGWIYGGTIIHPLMYSWDGRSWTTQAGEGFWGEMGGVSCTSGDRCAAVGSTFNTEAGGSTAQLWDGESWSAPAVTWPPGTYLPTLSGVSCTAADRCVAVGSIDPGSDSSGGGVNSGMAAAVTWNGTAWTVMSVPAPRAGQASEFNAVTCLTPTDCVAVGQAGPVSTANGSGLSGFWNGKRWRLVAAQ